MLDMARPAPRTGFGESTRRMLASSEPRPALSKTAFIVEIPTCRYATGAWLKTEFLVNHEPARGVHRAVEKAVHACSQTPNIDVVGHGARAGVSRC